MSCFLSLTTDELSSLLAGDKLLFMGAAKQWYDGVHSLIKEFNQGKIHFKLIKCESNSISIIIKYNDYKV